VLQRCQYTIESVLLSLRCYGAAAAAATAAMQLSTDSGDEANSAACDRA
jgi:hypothetical protein